CVIVRAMMPAEFVVSRSRRWGKKCDTFGLTNGRKSIGPEIAPAHPAPRGTGGMRAEVPRGVHVARPSPRGHEAGWRATGRLGDVLVGLLTGGTRGLAGQTCKRFRLPRALAGSQRRWGERRARDDALGWPHPMEHTAQPQKGDQR